MANVSKIIEVLKNIKCGNVEPPYSLEAPLLEWANEVICMERAKSDIESNNFDYTERDIMLDDVKRFKPTLNDDEMECLKNAKSILSEERMHKKDNAANGPINKEEFENKRHDLELKSLLQDD